MIGIYKITSPSGKIYIGQSINIENRWNKHYKKLNCKGQVKLYSSFLKYGVENHKFEIIEECNELYLLERETYYKNLYKVLEIPSLCCRIDGKGGRLSNEIKEKIGKSNTNKQKSLEIRIKISNSMKNKHHSELTKDKIRKSNIGKSKSKEHCKNISKSKLGKKRDKNIFKTITKPVFQYDLQGNFIKEFESINEAGKYFNVHPNNIGLCCNNKIKTSCGFNWKFKIQ